MSESTKIRLAGLWAHRTRNGLEYFSGSIGSAKLLIFSNDHKRGDSDPDYVLYLAASDRTAERSGGTPASSSSTPLPPARRGKFQPLTTPGKPVSEDDIPF